MSILITGVGGDIGQSVIKCLREGRILQLIGCDTDPYAAGQKQLSSFLVAPEVVDEVGYFKFIERVIEQYKVRYIYPTTELEIELFDRKRNPFEKLGVTLLINNPFIIDTFMDKHKTIKFLRENGLPYPVSYPIEAYNGELGYPILIKARRGWGGKGLTVVNNADELQFHSTRVPSALVQEVIGTNDEEYTAGVFSDGRVVHSICFRRYLGYGSLSKFVELVHAEEVESIARKIAETTQLDGCINVQLRKHKGRFTPFEVNPRISSTAYFRHYFGFEDVKWWLDSKEGKPIAYTPKYSSGIGVKTTREVFFNLEARV